MAKEKFPRTDEIPWNSIRQIRVSSDEGSYSFEFDINGKTQKMTISVQPDKTSFTLSKADGSPIVHATQYGKEVRIFDFSSKPSLKAVPAKVRTVKVARKK